MFFFIFLDFAYELLMDLQARVKATDDEMVGGIKEHLLFTPLPIIEIHYIGCCFHHKANVTFVLLFSLIANSLYAFDTALLPLSSPILFFPLCLSAALLLHLLTSHSFLDPSEKRKMEKKTKPTSILNTTALSSFPTRSQSKAQVRNMIFHMIWRRF